MNETILSIIGASCFISLEIGYYFYIRKKEKYNYDNAVSNLSIGIAERLINLFMLPLFFLLFKTIYEHYRIFTIPETWYNYIVILLATDFVWYWYHRLGHRVNLFWAAHIVHHQSEDFNLTVAARITIFQAYVRSLFWCLLPLIGFKVEMIMSILVFHAGYSFFTHTQLGKNLGILEFVFITPSLHGVHHASNEKYLDKNFGDVFVFWDKMFGTFQKEEEEPVFGLTKPLMSKSFLWQHFHYYLELAELAKQKQGIKNKLMVWLSPPDSMDESIREKLEKKWLIRNNENLAKPYKSYLNFQLLLSLGLLLFLSLFYAKTNWLSQLEIFLFILLTLINIGAIIERKGYVFHIEVIRFWQFLLYIGISYELFPLFLFFSVVMSLCLIFLPIRNFYFKIVFKA